MELDLAQVRAFVEAAGQLHFGRAAARLYLTQQALSSASIGWSAPSAGRCSSAARAGWS